jgi:Domain of unknown function (DUF4166)
MPFDADRSALAMSASATLYQRLLGADYAQLDTSVQRFHAQQGTVVLEGFAQVSGPSNLAGRLVALLIGTPTRSTQAPIRFQLSAEPQSETWTRYFDGRTMRSRLSGDHGLLCERLGATTLRFAIQARDGKLEQVLVAMRCFGVPVPRLLWPRIVARESGNGERFEFHVEAHVPLVGRVVKYVGHLQLPTVKPAP